MSATPYKIVLGGAFGSGRTTFASRFKEGKKEKKTLKAIKVDQFPVNVYTSAGTAQLTFFDTLVHAKGGQPDDAFFRNAHAAVLFFDVTNQASYDALQEWYDSLIKSNGRDKIAESVIIVGTKIDEKSRDVKPKDISLPKKLGAKYIEISAKANYNVKELVLLIVSSLLGEGTQLTDEIALESPSAEVDEAKAEAARKEYEDANK